MNIKHIHWCLKWDFNSCCSWTRCNWYWAQVRQYLHEVIGEYAYNDKQTLLVNMPIDTQCLLWLHDELDLSPDEFLSHLQLNISRQFFYDAQSVQSAWRSFPLDIISKLEEKFFPQWGRFKNPEEDHPQPYNTGSTTPEKKKKRKRPNWGSDTTT